MRRLRKKMIFNELFIEFDEFKFDWSIKVKKFQKETNEDQIQDSRV